MQRGRQRFLTDHPVVRAAFTGNTSGAASSGRSRSPIQRCRSIHIWRISASSGVRSALGSSNAGGVTGRQWPVHRTSSVDWSERHFQLRVENTWEHNAAEIADALAVCQEETGADLLILVGDDRERRSVHERLPSRLQERIAEALRDPADPRKELSA